MARARIWALVTNGVHARIVGGLESVTSEAPGEIISKTRDTHLREILADKSDRSFASVGGEQRSAMEPRSDPIRLDMQEFARETIERLEESHRSGQFDLLAIFAEPKMLDILRQEMPAALRQAVFLERANNLVQLDAAELRSKLTLLLRTMSKSECIG